MAGDGRATRAGMITDTRARKVHKLRDGRIVGMAGPAASAPVFLEWLVSGVGHPPKNIEALVLEPSGKLWLYESGAAVPALCDEPQALGTGAPHALTAMDCGKSPTEAVRLAAKRDTSTGGRIVTLALGPRAK